MVKTREQEKHYHAVIREIAHARGVSLECAKRVLIVKFRAETENDTDFQGLWPEDSRSRRFPRALAIAFLDWLYAWQVHNVVEKQEAPEHA